MTLKIYNTLARKKQEFVPLNPPKVGMYVCGVTVYDECHLGHARAVFTFDVIYRYLKHRGYEVTYVRNFTDVDDKIINRANQEGVSWKVIAEKYIAAFGRDMGDLGTLVPTHEPKATEHIAHMQKIIKGLVEKQMAYPIEGDVFYSVRKKKDYGKLSGKKIDELEAGARIEIHEAKKEAIDFALWKKSKPDEPQWDSPWGPGRPGWHIECSAMSMHFLGSTFDIHGGGRDLMFPHHENEIAQSEGFSEKPFVRYWIHNGFININAEKMSKSLGNFFTIHELLKRYHPEALRLLILAAHYRSPLDYTEKIMEATQASLDRWYATLARVSTQCQASSKSKDHPPKDLVNKVESLVSAFEEAMDDDFNTAKVVGLLFDLVREWNKYLDGTTEISGKTCQTFLKAAQTIHGVLGLFGSDPQVYLNQVKALKMVKVTLSDEEIQEKINQRNSARQTKNWALADAIRNELASLGITLKDNPDGTTGWNI
ncbi:MAG: cysteine--tRNA ligase [Deltaproteobacteria bacterium RIFCSPLOWO2_12_FULL_40_28]|nr:MAG: cysteine--tRNA ligase [Deltaproteobacteria bacterium RIFCSPHIGHO2_02_FULL_40_28]OGQ19568.1 MAG: cysteine--tRNA ligase [Deltaproteobacteria bacterium RIFCSPHIGHO2_12_FULL_40_32]OGQ40845.1 MAG: cysteine--tRNA ligase [Deltaproteobacteria bacterium RIFCSPLOWO2_02_FULL_40_36]OGQ53960.1 MAG: cysteine--tRNA ligase [Deltaproteobacteria bacterium RIFCSPLOWO2_12_FULL_40_28]